MDKVEIELRRPNAQVPKRGSEGAAGYDLFSAEEVTVMPWSRKLVDTGVAIALPVGHYGRIAPRSGLALKQGIDVLAGVIDVDYRDTFKVLLQNLSDDPFEVKVGHRIAQLIITPYATVEFKTVSKLSETDRGLGGFGHTGA